MVEAITALTQRLTVKVKCAGTRTLVLVYKFLWPPGRGGPEGRAPVLMMLSLSRGPQTMRLPHLCHLDLSDE